MLSAGAKNLSLTKYLIQQVLLSKEQRMEELREFIPDAKSEDWDLVIAGQRVQVIKDTEAGGKGTLQFGTEVVSAEDGSIAALLGGFTWCINGGFRDATGFGKLFPSTNQTMGAKDQRNDPILWSEIVGSSRVDSRYSSKDVKSTWISKGNGKSRITASRLHSRSLL